MNKQLGNRIKKIRINKDIDAKKVAVEIGVRDTSYSKIERVGTNNLERLYKIAAVLNVRITDFFEDSLRTVNEPTEKFGFVTRDELAQSQNELMNFIKNEITKIVSPSPKKASTYQRKKNASVKRKK